MFGLMQDDDYKLLMAASHHKKREASCLPFFIVNRGLSILKGTYFLPMYSLYARAVVR
jgi:hypothetical protein